MQIKIYGPGWNRCQALEKNTRDALETLGMKAEIVKISDVNQMVEDNVFSTPGLAIDGKVVSMGKVLDVEEIEKLLS